MNGQIINLTSISWFRFLVLKISTIKNKHLLSESFVSDDLNGLVIKWTFYFSILPSQLHESLVPKTLISKMWDLVLKYLRKTRSWSFFFEFREQHNTGTIWKAITDLLRYLPVDCYSTSSNGNPAISQRGNHTIPKRSTKVHGSNHTILKRSTKVHGSITNDNSQRNKKKHHHPPHEMEEEALQYWSNRKTNSSCSNRHHPPSGDSHQYKEKKRKVDGSDGTQYWSGFCLFGVHFDGQTKVSLKKGRQKV